MEVVLIRAAQLILSLSILIVFHEFGHYFFAKLFGARVEKFYLFFNPWFSLFKFKRGDTEYGIGWVPLGGYVKISGMIDESMDKEAMAAPPKPYEFRTKPAWQRLLIMIGGVSVNIILAFVIYIFIMWIWGETYLPTQNAKYGIICDSAATEMGLKNGDKIISVDNKVIEKFSDITPTILLDESKSIQILRNDTALSIDVPRNLIKNVIKRKGFIREAFPFVVDSFTEKSQGKVAGLVKGDIIVGINGEALRFFHEYPARLDKLKNQKADLAVIRGGDTLDIKTNVDADGKLGVYPLAISSKLFELRKIDYSFWAAIPRGIKKGATEVSNYLKQFKLLFSSETEAYKELGGFITIATIFPAQWDWYAFWMMTAFLSIILGVINLFPIPALDGGHVMFLLYEMISGRKPSDKFMEYAQIVGMVLLFGLLIYANGNDIVKLFR